MARRGLSASLGIGFTNFRANRHHTVDADVSLEHFHATDVTVKALTFNYIPYLLFSG